MNNPKKHKKPPQKNSRFKPWIALIALLFLLLFGGWKLSQLRDKARFLAADERKQTMVTQLQERAGQPIARTEKNICYNAEEGPYDNGRLWCQTASALYYASEKPQPELEAHFNDIVAENGWKNINERAQPLEFEGARDLPCTLDIYTDTLASEPPDYLPPNTSSKQTLVVQCASRASYKHYEYVN